MGKNKGQKGPTWPAWDPIDEPILRAHATDFIKKTSAIEAIAKEAETAPPYELFHQIVEAATALALRIKKEPSIAHLTQELQAIRTTLENQETNQKETVKTLNNLGNQSTRLVAALSPTHSTTGRLPWATVASSSHVTSSSSWVSGWQRRVPSNLSAVASNVLSSNSNSSLPAAFSPADLQIHIRGTTASVVNPLRRHEAEVVKRANMAINDLKDRVIAHRKIASGRILPSGDVILEADSPQDVEELVRKPEWCQTFGEHATIRKRTYGVIMHDVSTSRVSLERREEVEETRTQLRAENAGRMASIPANTAYIGWLLGQGKIKDLENSMLVLEFEDERAANIALSRGLVLYGKNHTCTLYDKSQKLQQCFKCQAYGHIARYCKRDPQCAYCAGEHLTEKCTRPKDRSVAKCAVCSDPRAAIKDVKKTEHFAFDRECPVRRSHLDIARDNRIHGPRYYPPAYRSDRAPPSIEERSSEPTPAEASQVPSQRKSRPTPRHVSQPSTQTRSKSRAGTTTRGRSKSVINTTTTTTTPTTATTRLSAKKTRLHKDDEMDEQMRAHQPGDGVLQEINIDFVNQIQHEPTHRKSPSHTPERAELPDLLGSFRNVRKQRSARTHESDDELSAEHPAWTEPSEKENEDPETEEEL
jgi:hypothetical protein